MLKILSITTFWTAVAINPLPSFGGVTSPDIEGSWTCDPYTMTGKNFKITVEEKHTYEKGGKHLELSISTLSVESGTTVTKSRLTGVWVLKNGIIVHSGNVGEFLSSSNPAYTIAMGQRELDSQLMKKNWAKMRVLEFRKRLITTPVKPMYKEAQVLVTCSRSYDR